MYALLLLAAAQAGPTAPEAPLIPAFFTGERLRAICDQPDQGLCSMYVAGVLDGLFYAGSKSDQPSLCRSPITNREAAELVMRYLDQNPAARGRAAAVGVEQALSGRLDCHGEQARAATPN